MCLGIRNEPSKVCPIDPSRLLLFHRFPDGLGRLRAGEVGRFRLGTWEGSGRALLTLLKLMDRVRFLEVGMASTIADSVLRIGRCGVEYHEYCL